MRLVVASKPVKDWERRESNIAASKSFPLFKPQWNVSGPVVLCAAGPSLLENLELVRAFYEAGVPICAIKGVGSFLIKRGIIPKYCVFLDSRHDQLRLVGTTHQDTIYCLASQVCPEIYQALEGRDIRVFHASSPELHNDGDDYITGGSTTSLRAINLMRWAGHDSFHVIGLDCCESDGVSHVYEKTSINKTLTVTIAGQEFQTKPDLVAQHQEFLEQYVFGKPPLNVTVYGGAIEASIQAILNRQSPWMEVSEDTEGVTLLKGDEIAAFKNAGNALVPQEPQPDLTDDEKSILALEEKPLTVSAFFEGRRGVVVSDDKILEHALHALARKWPEHRWVNPHTGEGVICGGGPSIKSPKVLNEIRRLAKKAFILTVNMTHDHFLDLPARKLGPVIVPHASVLIDPKERIKDYVHPISGPLYFVASQCDPATLDVFEKPGVKKFLFHHEDKSLTPHLKRGNHVTPPMFSTVGLESILILYRLGFRKIHLFAMESSYRTEIQNGKLVPKDLHGYWKEKEYLDVLPVAAVDKDTGEREEFLTNAHMACQTEDFRAFVPFWDHHVKLGNYEPIQIIVHGEGYLPAAAKILHRQFPWVKNGTELHKRLRSRNHVKGPRHANRGKMQGAFRQAHREAPGRHRESDGRMLHLDSGR